MTSGTQLKTHARYVVMRVSERRYVVGRSVPGLDDSFIDICETKTELNARRVMEALARMEESSE